MRALVLICVLSAACSDSSSAGNFQFERPIAPSAKPLANKRVEHLALVAARSAVVVKSEISGRLSSQEVTLGATVEKGQSLAFISNQRLEHSLAAAAASREAARARLDQARNATSYLSEVREVNESLAESVSRIERRKSGYEADRAKMEERFASSDLAGRAAETRRLQTALDARQVLAPFHAEVAAILCAEGDHVEIGAPLFRLVSKERLVRFALDAEDATSVHIGSKFEFVWQLNRASSSLEVIVEEMAPEVDAAGMILFAAAIAQAEVVPPIGVRGVVRKKY
jgi:multidrug efflux pump subunit AcrA (membrane-fusion protein)